MFLLLETVKKQLNLSHSEEQRRKEQTKEKAREREERKDLREIGSPLRGGSYLYQCPKA